MPSKKVTCGFASCDRPCRLPRTIKAARCWEHPLPVAAAVTPRPAAQALSSPVLAAAPEQPAAPLIEIPDTREGWADALRELGARMSARAQTPPLRLTCAGGEFTVAPLVDGAGHARLATRGRVSLGPSRYTVYGLPWQVNVQTGDYGCGRAAGSGRATRVRAVVTAAWVADGEHVALREMYLAYMAASNCVSSYGWTARPGTAGRVEVVRALGRRALLSLAAIELRGKARDVALQWVENGFPGTVQELLEASLAVAAE